LCVNIIPGKIPKKVKNCEKGTKVQRHTGTEGVESACGGWKNSKKSEK
jgi:hypothetical protein